MFDQLLEPFATWDVGVIAKWYIACLVAALLLAAIHKKLGIVTTSPIEKDIPAGPLLLLAGFIMPIFEEVVFRGVPSYFGGFTLVLAGTIIWTLLHKKRALIIAPFGILWFKMWMGGFGVEATAMHILHNSAIVAIFLTKQGAGDIKEFMEEEEESDFDNHSAIHTEIRIDVDN